MSVGAEFPVGSEFAGYLIEGLLGWGGMGVVYKAHDPRLKRSVALKLVAPGVSGDRRFRERFLVETELAASLEHPNVVPVYDAGEVEGRLYLVMRLVDGSDLKSLLAEEGALEPEQAMAICRQVGAALDAAHASGLVHRDVKPSNVLLDERGHAYLTDFGLSRRVADARLSTVGALPKGTPAYMAPEQVEGGEVDARTDVYGLGCLLYECLTGRQPYEGGSDLAVLLAKLQSPPPKPSEADRRLPVELDDVVARAMEQSPDARCGSCRDLIEDAVTALAAGRGSESSRPMLPGGTVTFLFTDIEGSTRLLKELGRDAYESVLAEQGGIVRAAVAAHNGWVVDTQGDSLFCAFRAAGEAVAAAVEAQCELAEASWPQDAQVRVRMGLHSGEPKAGEERYVGIGVHEAARVGDAAHGGQVLLSGATRALLDALPAGLELRDLGLHRLKDIDDPVRLYQATASGLQEQFPQPRTLGARHDRLLRRGRVRAGLIAVGLVAAAAAALGYALSSTSPSAKPVHFVSNSIAVVDSRTGRPVGDVPLGFTPADVNASGGRVWALNQTGGTVVAIDPRTLKVVQTVGLNGNPSSQYAVGSNDYVALPGAVDQINNGGATKITLWAPVHLGHGGAPSSGYGSCLSFVTGNGRTVWVSEGRHFAELDASGSVLRTSTLPAAPDALRGSTCYGVRYTGGQLFAIRDPDESVGTLDPRSGAYAPLESGISGMTATSQAAGKPGWAAGFGSLWLTGSNVNLKTVRPQGVVTRYDLSSGQLTGRTPISGNLGRLAVDPASGIWVVDKTGLALVHVDPATGQVTQRLSLHHFPCCPSEGLFSGIATGHGRVWVVLQSP
jgi:class 3 adenylate cyclase/tRNA A-37 threonylcarbamoyl transferase component Bud32/DNA-binding beta-propeller fold protein YncE